MPLLIGTAPNQIPTNADLGTLAFQDAASVNIQGGLINGLPISSILNQTKEVNTTQSFNAIASKHYICTNSLQVTVTLPSAPTAGTGILPPDWLTICAMARFNSSSVKSAAPPLAGMALKPVEALVNSVSKP